MMNTKKLFLIAMTAATIFGAHHSNCAADAPTRTVFIKISQFMPVEKGSLLIKVTPTDTGYDLKKIAASELNLPPQELDLAIAGSTLRFDQSIKDRELVYPLTLNNFFILSPKTYLPLSLESDDE